ALGGLGPGREPDAHPGGAPRPHPRAGRRGHWRAGRLASGAVLPLRDVNPTRRVPVLTIGLIAANVAVFLFQLQKPNDNSLHGQTAFQCEWGLVPDHLLHGGAGPAASVGTTCQELNAEHDRYAQLFTSQFLHGSWLHLLGNML